MNTERSSDTDWVRRHTNIADLLDDGTENGSDLRPVTGSREGSDEPLAAEVEVRSTTDPVEVQFAGATLTDKLQSTHATPRMRLAGFVLMALIPDGFLTLVCIALYRSEPQPESAWAFWAAVWLAIGGHLLLWAWIVTRRRAARTG